MLRTYYERKPIDKPRGKCVVCSRRRRTLNLSKSAGQYFSQVFLYCTTFTSNCYVAVMLSPACIWFADANNMFIKNTIRFCK